MIPSAMVFGIDYSAALHWLKHTPASEGLAESDWLFPAIESAHVIAIALVVGSIAVVDFRLLGLTSRQRTIEAVTRAITPLTWTAFACAALTGAALFTAKPVTYGQNPFFLAKIALIGLAGLNMAAFHLWVEPRVGEGLPGLKTLTLGQVSGAASLIVWTAVVACGRWIGFTI